MSPFRIDSFTLVEGWVQVREGRSPSACHRYAPHSCVGVDMT